MKTKSKPAATPKPEIVEGEEGPGRRGRPHAPVARDKSSLVFPCGAEGVIAKLNGTSASFVNLENVGKCVFDVFCADSNGNEIANTRVRLKLGHRMRSMLRQPARTLCVSSATGLQKAVSARSSFSYEHADGAWFDRPAFARVASTPQALKIDYLSPAAACRRLLPSV